MLVFFAIWAASKRALGSDPLLFICCRPLLLLRRAAVTKSRLYLQRRKQRNFKSLRLLRLRPQSAAAAESLPGPISVASGRRFPSDTGAFADWVASSAAAARGDDLSLGFNASAAAAAAAASASGASLGTGLWGPASSASAAAMRQAAAMNYGMADVGMVVVAPAASFHHTHHHHHHHEAAAAAASGDPIFPLLSGGPCVLDPDAAAKSASSGAPASAIQFWQPPLQSPSSAAAAAGANPNPSASPFAYLKKPLPMLDACAGSSGSGATTCQDCGNQAKKDCGHNRCRTCCKSRGFDCSTHVKSTWVPAARRRERQQLATSGSASSSPATATASAAAVAASASKKPRLLSSQTTTSHTSTSNATTPRSFDTTSSHHDASFRDSLPRHVRAPAVFKCVRVTSIEDGEDEYAYQATVTINGHLFKGFLYDQGPDDGRHAATSNDDSTAGVPNISELHLGAASGSGAGGVREGGTSMAPTELYGGGGHHLHILGGSSSYGNTMN